MSPDKTAIEKLWERHHFVTEGLRQELMTKKSFLAAISEAEGERWISVEEEPDYDRELWLWSPLWPRVYLGYWRHSCEWIGRHSPEETDTFPDTDPTLWMYVKKPAPPKEKP